MREGTARRRIRDVIDRLVRDSTAVSRTDGTLHTLFPVAISPAEGEELRAWVVRESATRTIEVGLGYGVSALFICEGLLANGDVAAPHVVIDPHQSTRFGNCGLQFLADAGLEDMVELHADESQVVLPRLLSEGRRFDFAFVDGPHRFEAVFVDLFNLGRLVRSGGIVFVEDYQLPAVAGAVSHFTTHLGWMIEEVSSPDEHHQRVVLRTPVAA
jgi:predicted O-methyltransferase YrrM